MKTIGIVCAMRSELAHILEELKDARCTLCGQTPVTRDSEHLFFELEPFRDFLKAWIPAHTAPDVANKLLSNMSTRMAQNIRDDLEITTNVRMKDVEEAQQRIVDIIRKLEEQNEIIIIKGGKDDIIA